MITVIEIVALACLAAYVVRTLSAIRDQSQREFDALWEELAAIRDGKPPTRKTFIVGVGHPGDGPVMYWRFTLAERLAILIDGQVYVRRENPAFEKSPGKTS